MTKNEQKVINYMVENPQLDFLAREIEKKAKISKAGANLALRGLIKTELIKRTKRGNIYFYSVDFNKPQIKELKKINIITKLAPLIDKLKSHTLNVILFGSVARGENLSISDLDLFIVSHRPQKVKDIINHSSFKKKLHVVIKTPIDAMSFNNENPILAREIESGIILWKQL
tara:strand:+ start:4485 stop:5000 length:516 start_codon:yes stop_codon:yes gene_type:complete